MTVRHVLAIDQATTGSTGSTGLVLDETGRVRAKLAWARDGESGR